MANFKANRTEEDILREMTAILRELKDPRIDPMLTVVRAELSGIFRTARSSSPVFPARMPPRNPARDWTAPPAISGVNCCTV